MTSWPATRASRVFAALLKIGWSVKRQSPSHRTLEHAGRPDFVFPFHSHQELATHMLERIAAHTGLTPQDL